MGTITFSGSLPSLSSFTIIADLFFCISAPFVGSRSINQISQLKAYLQHDEKLQKLENLKAYVIVFVGNKGEIIEL
jgi:hypothetical protein